MNKITIEKYVADDGTEFDNEKDCVKYEGTDYTEYMLKDIPYRFVATQSWFSGLSDCECLLLFKIENRDQADRMEEWASTSSLYNNGLDAREIVGHTILFDVDVNWGLPTELSDITAIYEYLGTEEQYIGSFARTIMLGIARAFNEK